jgi:zona occludens toxin (predicted ATPase)
MITLYSGVPGSGKSYKMVAELSRQKDKYYVVHNIDGLKDGYLGDYGINFVTYCNENDLQIQEFFSKEYQIKFSSAVLEKYKRPVLVIIDEAQEWFSKTNHDIKMWLSYHRHLNQDVWLVAHRLTNIPQVYRSFIEVEFRAKSGHYINVPGYFIYNRILGGQRAGYVKEKRNPEIFSLYKSAMFDVQKKRKKSGFLLLLGVIILVGLVGFIIIPQFLLSSDEPLKTKETGEKSPVKKETAKLIEAAIKEVASSEHLEKLYRYVGVNEGVVILENRQTGEQLNLEKIRGRLKYIEHDGLNSVLLYSMDERSFHRFFNSDAFKDRSPGSPGESLSPGDPGDEITADLSLSHQS